MTRAARQLEPILSEGILPLPMIAIMSFPRTGSSMTAGLFAKHGVWVGNCREGDGLNKKGYFENQDFKRLVKGIRLIGIHIADRTPFEPDKRVTDRLINLQPEAPWLVKSSAMYWKQFDHLKPYYICVRRNKADCMASNKRALLYREGHEASFDRHAKEMDYLVETRQAINVYTDEVNQGDYSSLERAFEHCGIEIDLDIVKDFVSPKLWHSK